MPNFSKTSQNNLDSCHKDLRTLCDYMIQHYDFSVVFGHRSMSIQNALFLKGRRLIPGEVGDRRDHYQIVDINRVVTYRGFEKASKHNTSPSLAIDIIPWPSGWSSEKKIYELAGFAKASYVYLKEYGLIKSEFRFGSDWKNPADPAHIEIV